MARWVKGQSGNPKGRPRRGRTVAELMRAIGREEVEYQDRAGAKDQCPEVNRFSRRERLVRVLWTMAVDGDLIAARLLVEHMEGRPTQRFEGDVNTMLRFGGFSADDAALAMAKLGGFAALAEQLRLTGGAKGGDAGTAGGG